MNEGRGWVFARSTENSFVVIGGKTENMDISLVKWVDRYGACGSVLFCFLNWFYFINEVKSLV